jgi:hypothetical protein
VFIAVLMILALVFALYGAPDTVEGMIWVIALPAVGLVVEWWVRRKEQSALLEFLKTALAAEELSGE